jgi:hypothetical protein
MTSLAQLVAFPPLFAARRHLYAYLVDDFFPTLGSINEEDLEVGELDQLTQHIRVLISQFRDLGLVGGSYSEQRRLAYWFWKDGHDDRSIEALNKIHRQAYYLVTKINSNNPLHSLLRRTCAGNTPADKPIVIPKRTQPQTGYEKLANALEAGVEDPQFGLEYGRNP